MKRKPFYNPMTYPVRRHRLNPFRWIFGDWYMTHSIQKWINQQNLDSKNIRLVRKD